MRKPRPKVQNCPCPDCSGSSGSVIAHRTKKKQKPAKFKTIKDRAGFDVYDEAKALLSVISKENGDHIPTAYHELLLAIWRYEDVMNLKESNPVTNETPKHKEDSA